MVRVFRTFASVSPAVVSQATSRTNIVRAFINQLPSDEDFLHKLAIIFLESLPKLLNPRLDAQSSDMLRTFFAILRIESTWPCLSPLHSQRLTRPSEPFTN